MSRPVESPTPSPAQRLWILVRSSAVGVAATSSDLATLCLLVCVFGVDDHLANAPSLVPGLIVMFVGNKFFAFEDHSHQVVRQGVRFLLVELIAFVLNALLYSAIRHALGLPPVLARILGTGVTYFGFSFPMWSLLVFKYRRTDESGQKNP